ncbi:MAG TPA: RNA polymerase-binding protein DksA [Steroidobacteraceae bacterium]|jgi:DnaK suppressor protein|nr:RNA polymerase-binding protein DksA [Steroidobacteraceae bacterium]
MPAKRPAPKSAKGKKAVSRPAARKTVAARKPEPARARTVAHQAHAHKSVASARKPPVHTAAPAHADNPLEKGKPARHPPPRELPRTPTPVPQAAARPAPDADDVEGAEPGSLLAGPRDVQPYIVKRGEAYMSTEQLDHFRNILHSWKRDLMVEVDRTVSHMKDEAANFPDPNDRATQEEEFSLELRTRDRERKLIRKIDEALKRIDDGSYGYCLETGEEIGIKRLEARPVATLSIEAQERRERRERQYGDRDDRYR